MRSFGGYSGMRPEIYGSDYMHQRTPSYHMDPNRERSRYKVSFLCNCPARRLQLSAIPGPYSVSCVSGH